ncbi:hypothetical protein EDB89DRAFT_2251091 [Lactarius sanguifluus]|nr:hypothetical protein EDB89DRAFT_2251091 [Lactarius sanguifluus]
MRKVDLDDDLADHSNDGATMEPNTEPASDDYESIKAMADADNEATSFRSEKTRGSVDILLIFRYQDDYIHPVTAKFEPGTISLRSTRPADAENRNSSKDLPFGVIQEQGRVRYPLLIDRQLVLETENAERREDERRTTSPEQLPGSSRVVRPMLTQMPGMKWCDRLISGLVCCLQAEKKYGLQNIIRAVVSAPNANAVIATRGEDLDRWINIVDKPNTDDQDAPPSVLTVTT